MFAAADNFDTLIDRRASDSIKWTQYPGEDMLPLWVADMDFRSPEPIIRALHHRVDHGVFGYMFDMPELRDVLVERMAARYDWQIHPNDIEFIPGLVCALNVITRALTAPGDGIVIQPPVYPPFFSAIFSCGREQRFAELACVHEGQTLHYEIDFDVLEAAITPQTKLFILCNPHNPVGRVFTRAELERIAEISLRHDLLICSDEIHGDLILDGAHTPIATLAPEVAQRTITLYAPSKTFNMPGLGLSVMIVENPEIRKQLERFSAGLIPHVNNLGFAAALAAYRECQPWLDNLLVYLRANRDTLVEYVRANFPSVAVTQPEGTYLAWLDFHAVKLPTTPYRYFLTEAQVALNDGVDFWRGSKDALAQFGVDASDYGADGVNFVRLNFGCPRAVLTEALDRMRAALDRA